MLPRHDLGSRTTDPPSQGDGGSDDDLLAAALEEVVYLLDTTGEAPVDVRLSDTDGGMMVGATDVPQLGAVPKGVSLNDLELCHGSNGWRCSATLDV